MKKAVTRNASQTPKPAAARAAVNKRQNAATLASKDAGEKSAKTKSSLYNHPEIRCRG